MDLSSSSWLEGGGATEGYKEIKLIDV